MVRLEFAITLQYDVDAPGGDFIFALHAAQTARQHLVREALAFNHPVQHSVYEDSCTHNRLLRLHAGPGPLSVRYDAVVDIDHHVAHPDQIRESAVADLPGTVLNYLHPSRYCPSDRLQRMACANFGHLPKGYRRVEAIRDWVAERVCFRPGTSTPQTTALDTLVECAGVCRDFAHLMIALCRAVNIPARFVSGIDYGADPSLGPMDFHAYVEVYLDGHWYLFDPSKLAIPMGFVRLATGRDAADTSFATIYGPVRGQMPLVEMRALTGGGAQPLEEPRHVEHALSTYGELAPA